MSEVSIAPFLRDTRTDDVIQFHPEAAKNPYLVPHWDMPDWISTLSKAAQTHAMMNAATAVEMYELGPEHVAAINGVRNQLGGDAGLAINDIGLKPGQVPKPKRKAPPSMRKVDTFEGTAG